MEQKEIDILVAIIKEGKLVQVTNTVRSVYQEFMKVDWDWLGFGLERDSGDVDEKMYWRMWVEVKELLGWEVDWDHRVGVFDVFLEGVSNDEGK